MPDNMNVSDPANSQNLDQHMDPNPGHGAVSCSPPPEYSDSQHTAGHNNGSSLSTADQNTCTQQTSQDQNYNGAVLEENTTQPLNQTYSDTEAPPPYPGPEPPPYMSDYPAPPYPGPPPSAAAAAAAVPTYPSSAWNVPPQSDFNKAQYHQFHQVPPPRQVPQTSQPQSIHLQALVVSGHDGSKPNTWLALSVVTCLCFSPLFGLCAICFSMAAHTSYTVGDLEGARRNANVSLALSFLGITLSIVMAIFIFSMY